MRRRLIPAAVILFLAATGEARADYWIVTPPGYRSIGGGARCGPYKTYEEAMQVNRQYFDGRRPIEGGPSPDPVPSAEGGGATGDPVFDAMRPMLMDLSSQFGAALGRALFGDPAEKARRAREDAWRRAQEAEREAVRQRFAQDMSDKEAREERRVREERHAKLSARLMKLGNGIFGDGDREAAVSEVDLRPGGTSFFGIGGGDRSAEQPHNDPRVVDLRHLRRGAFLAQAAADAPPQDAEILLDEAMAVSTGGRGFVPVYDEEAPALDGKGLLAFQEANADYAKANDFRATVTRHEQETLRVAERSAGAARQAREEYETAKAAGLKGPELEAKRLKAEGLFAEARREQEAWQQVHEESLRAETEEALAWSRSRRTLKAVSAGRDPDADPFEKAPPTGVDGKAWKGFQEGMIADRKAAEAERARLLKDLPEPPPPGHAEKVRVHEGVILGTFGSQQTADQMAQEGRSALTGKTYQEMNDSEFWSQPGRQGAVVAGFGTPEDTKANLLKEAARVPGDHFTGGQVSLQTPQAKQALAQLEGKSYDRLVAHSNGSPVALALIERGSIEVNELHVVGGDRALTDARYLQNLIDRGKVKRVVVWTHTNDPILATNAIPVRADEAELLAEHVARKATGTAKGGDAKVQFVFSKGQGKGVFGPHYLQESYYPDMAKAYGVPWTPK